jgi:hypothetical protein
MPTRAILAPPMNSDFEDLLKVFNARSVEYLIVGGYAVMLYTEPRYTKDLDIWIAATPENATKVYSALAEFGAPLAGLTADDFAHEGFFYQLGQPPLRIDILMSIEGVTFEDAWPRRVESRVGSEPAWFIGKNELIRNKRAAGRHIDLHDADVLDG